MSCAAHATELDVAMEKDADGIVCIVRDNGVRPEGRHRPGSRPSRNSRPAQGLHGELEMASAPGRGTEMIISIPMPPGNRWELESWLPKTTSWCDELARSARSGKASKSSVKRLTGMKRSSQCRSRARRGR